MTAGFAGLPLDVFAAAAVAWAAGGRGAPLVDAAAEALAAGVDSPTFRQLAGAPRAFADEEATQLAPVVFAAEVDEAVTQEARLLAGTSEWRSRPY